MRAPRISLELMEWLKVTYPERCIGAHEEALDAHRYAAQVELAKRLIRMGEGDEYHDIRTQETD